VVIQGDIFAQLFALSAARNMGFFALQELLSALSDDVKFHKRLFLV